MRSPRTSLALILTTLCLLAGCSAGGDAANESMASDSGGGGESAEAGGDVAADGGGAVEESAPGLVGEQRSFVTSGSISLTVENTREAAAETARIVDAAGGYVEERQENGGADGAGSASMTVRIPATEVTPTLDALAALGEVEQTSQTSTEVTDQVRDLDARIRALEISIGRLEDLLGRSGTIPDIVEAERVLTERQSELEVLLSQQASLADQVDMATFGVELWSEGTAPEIQEEPTGFFAGLVTGWRALVATLTGLLQAFGVLLPWLLFAALVTAAVVALARWWRRRRPAPPAFPGPASGPTTGLPPMSPAPQHPADGGPARQPVGVGVETAPESVGTPPPSAGAAPGPQPAGPGGATAVGAQAPSGPPRQNR